MAASLSVNALQVNFESVLSMEHAGMGAVIEFFANAKVIAGMIVSFVENRKMVVTKDVFAETFQLPTEGPPNKKNEIKVEYRLLHDIVAKALCAKFGSFDVVTSEKLEIMVAINVGFKVNLGHILFQTIVSMVHTPSRQSQGFAMPLSILLEKVVKSDLGEYVALHPLKVLDNKSVLTYMKKNHNFAPAGESSKKAINKYDAICLWKFGAESPTSYLLPHRKDPLEDLITAASTATRFNNPQATRTLATYAHQHASYVSTTLLLRLSEKDHKTCLTSLSQNHKGEEYIVARRRPSCRTRYGSARPCAACDGGGGRHRAAAVRRRSPADYCNG
ncbi:hypothetical protein F511_18838 [Dorcoceras hygrometricum]|uniref:Uncharacterized protein n=1 Tax=Dorcoceras hygrometricum TaxID=472368 RepID=A0A2Z7C9Q7_9LAMI|nr:hypothetical protein F511_18838 [Dorcoceras hygrometricum]